MAAGRKSNLAGGQTSSRTYGKNMAWSSGVLVNRPRSWRSRPRTSAAGQSVCSTERAKQHRMTASRTLNRRRAYKLNSNWHTTPDKGGNPPKLYWLFFFPDRHRSVNLTFFLPPLPIFITRMSSEKVSSASRRALISIRWISTARLETTILRTRQHGRDVLCAEYVFEHVKSTR